MVFVGAAGGVVNPIVYLDENGLHMTGHSAQEAFGYENGHVVKTPIEGSWIEAAQSVIDQTGIEAVAVTFKFLVDLDVSMISYRLMPL